MQHKSKRTIAASALALAVAGGGAAAVLTIASPGPSVIAPASLPSHAGPAVTATVPGSDGGTGQSGTTGPAGRTGGGSGQSTGATGGTYAPGTAPESRTLTRAAGQGAPGPFAAGMLPADGAVPGARPTLRAMAAARHSITVLPHSPRLLAELGGTARGTSTPAATPAGGGDGTAVPGTAGTGSASGTGTPASTGSLSGAPGASRAGMAAAGATTPAASPSAVSPSAASPSAGSPSGGATSTTPAPTVTPTPTGTATAPAIPTANAGHTLPGLDVAGYQHPVSRSYPNGQPIGWSAVAAAGYKFVAVKATEGDYYVNPWGVSDVNAAKAAGLSVTPYHFAIPNASGGAAQAQYTLEYSGYKPGGKMLPLMLDIEYDPYTSSDHTNICYGLTPAQMTAWVGGFVNTVKSVTGLYPVIYTTADWWNTCTGGSTAFGADPMWVAAYGFSSPPMPAGWSAWTIWQYTSSGTVPGVATPGTTDLDIFNPGLVGLINPGSQAAKTRARVSVSVRSLGALAGEALTWSAAGLPPGLTVGASGMIAGTVSPSAAPVGARVYHVTISARNSAGALERATFAWQVMPTCAHHLTARICAGG